MGQNDVIVTLCNATSVFVLCVLVSACRVCRRAYLRNKMSKLHRIFGARYPRPWLGVPVCLTSDFVDDVVFVRNCSNDPVCYTQVLAHIIA